MAIYKAVLHHTSNTLPEWYLEAVGVLVSREGMKRLLKAASRDPDAYLLALSEDIPGPPFSAREQLGLAYTRKLTHTPGQIEEADVDALREAGFADGEVLELNQVAAYFAYANRTVTGLGVNTENEVLGRSPQTGDDKSGWSHG
jgi:hypothetical protein